MTTDSETPPQYRLETMLTLVAEPYNEGHNRDALAAFAWEATEDGSPLDHLLLHLLGMTEPERHARLRATMLVVPGGLGAYHAHNDGTTSREHAHAILNAWPCEGVALDYGTRLVQALGHALSAAHGLEATCRYNRAAVPSTLRALHVGLHEALDAAQQARTDAARCIIATSN